MGHVINKNDHPAYVRHPETDQLVPIASGAVREADGSFLDALLDTPGIETATTKDVKQHAADSADRASAGDSSQTPAGAVVDALVKARALATQVLAATNQIVIGDDQAPHGPPSGTVTTKQALAQADPAAFAENEASVVGKVDGSNLSAAELVAGATPASSADVHNAQVAAQEGVGEVAAALAALHAETEQVKADADSEPSETPAAPDDDDDDDDEPPTSATQPTDPYEGKTKPQLQDELRERELPVSGSVDELKARLRESDAANDEQL